jgi:hypothetical protein
MRKFELDALEIEALDTVFLFVGLRVHVVVLLACCFWCAVKVCVEVA